jgi:hypothetical protein
VRLRDGRGGRRGWKDKCAGARMAFCGVCVVELWPATAAPHRDERAKPRPDRRERHEPTRGGAPRPLFAE